jgi:hypothetical protein
LQAACRHTFAAPMHSFPSDTSPSFWQRAWTFSLVFHLLTTAILAVSFQQRRGGALQSVASAGIVLQLMSDDGRVDDAEEEVVASIVAPPVLETTPVEMTSAAPAVVRGPVETPPTPAPSPLAAEIEAARRAMEVQRAGGMRRASRSLRPGTLGGTSQAQVSVFGVQGTGTKFVYLFDRSASMEGAPLAAAKRQLVDSLASLDGIHQFQIIFFNSLPYPIDITGAGRMAFATDQNKRLAANIVGGITADLGTDRYTALKKAISFHPDVIFFLTDAEDEMLQSELNEIERANDRVGAAICVIEFGRFPAPLSENFLMRLARRSGGQYGYVNTRTLSE